MRYPIIVAVLTVALHLCAAAPAAPALVKTGESLLAESAHVTNGWDRARNGEPRFAGPIGARLLSYKGYQYAIYYAGKNRDTPWFAQSADVMVARRQLSPSPGGEWQRLKIAGYKITSDDAHNRPDLAISEGDGVIHVTFDHHNSESIHYARTAPGAADHPEQVEWKSDVFELTPNLGLDQLDGPSVTYPEFRVFPGGNLLLFYRGGGASDGEMVLAKYDSGSHEWGPVRSISTSRGTYQGLTDTRGPYLTGLMVGPDGRLSLAWLFREKRPAPGATPYTPGHLGNHGLYYATSPDQGVTWYNNAGKLVADTGKGQSLGVDNVGPPVVEIPRDLNPSNTSNAAALDPATGDVHVLNAHYARPGDSQKRVFHYVGTPDGKWTDRESDFSAPGVSLEFAGDRLFAFGGRNNPGAWVADRAEGFDNWTPLPLTDAAGGTIEFPRNGFGTWDLSRLAEGLVSLAWHEPTADPKAVTPSPIRVMDFRLAD